MRHFIYIFMLGIFLLDSKIVAYCSDAQDKIPPIGARVRVQAPSLGSGWHVGMFNQQRTALPCYRVLIMTSDGQTVETKAILSVKQFTRLQVSTLNKERPRRDTGMAYYTKEYEGERWEDVSLTPLQEADEKCGKP